jgi:hypothetical protein
MDAVGLLFYCSMHKGVPCRSAEMVLMMSLYIPLFLPLLPKRHVRLRSLVYFRICFYVDEVVYDGLNDTPKMAFGVAYVPRLSSPKSVCPSVGENTWLHKMVDSNHQTLPTVFLSVDVL